MDWYHCLTLAALLVCLASLSYHFIRLVRLGTPKEYSRPKGQTGAAITYAFFGAMSPAKKESAYLHLPTYAAGLLYHLGTFLSIALLLIFLLGFTVEGLAQLVLVCLLALSGLSGTGILVKRLIAKQLLYLSNPDDFISNLLVTVFQISTLVLLLNQGFAPYYFLSAALLLLYIPLGKLKHALYFFAARYHLGLFYGWRGIWPGRNS